MSGPERIRDLPRGLLVLALLPANLIFWSAAALVYSFFRASPRAANRCYRDFSRMSLFVAGTVVERHGIENLAAGQAYVVNRTGGIIAHTNPAVVLANTSIAGRSELANILRAPGNQWFGSYQNFEGNQVVGASAPVAASGPGPA